MTEASDMRTRRAAAKVGVIVAAGAVLGCLATGCGDPDTTSTQWDLVREPEAEMLVLSVRVGSSSCHAFDGVSLEESDSEVTIIATITQIGSPEKGCTLDDRRRSVDIALSEPLGDRPLRGCRPGRSSSPMATAPDHDCSMVLPDPAAGATDPP